MTKKGDKKSYNVKLDELIIENFRNTCRNIGIEQGKILEVLMQGFFDNKIRIGFNENNQLIIN